MNLSELCQFLEANIEKINPEDDLGVVLTKKAKTLGDLEVVPIPIMLPQSPGVAFVIEDTDMPLVDILKRAKSVIMLDTTPVLLAACDSCDCDECEIIEEPVVSTATLEEIQGEIDQLEGELKVLKTPSPVKETNEEVTELRDNFVMELADKVEEVDMDLDPPILLATIDEEQTYE
jgi:hypothetical protein